jgi:hypothetical protein
MTCAKAAVTFGAMTKNDALPKILLFALSALTLLALGHLIAFGVGLFGAGQTSTVALVANLAGVGGCALAAWGLTRIRSSGRLQSI